MSDRPGPSLDIATAQARRVHVEIRGAVQGVGFRPFIHNLAQEAALTGWVCNSARGVTLEAEGDAGKIARFLHRIETAPPPHAAIAGIDTADLPPVGGADFTIRESEEMGGGLSSIPPDLATCPDCLNEMFDPSDRRHLYPFISCTHCGPRFSIAEAFPYDRKRTSMRHFPLCNACSAEYIDPANRRFHAEATACPDCGPEIALQNTRGELLARGNEALRAAADALRDGRILALKGLGGFQLLADARREAAIDVLRQRKHRPDRPFAVMFPSLDALQRDCEAGKAEIACLTAPASPIVLLRRRADAPLASNVAPGNPWVGAFLPYTPLHHLLLRELRFPVIATSGNLSGDPMVTENDEALSQLGEIADLFLMHDRPIVRPVDDSVLRMIDDKPMPLRRARGFAPAPVPVPGLRPGILALGPHMKATAALTSERGVEMSPHIGDMENPRTRATHRRALSDLLAPAHARPGLVAHDMHPDYATTQMAHEFGTPTLAVPHHLAHVVACIAENEVAPPALGVAWDGTGYGPDGTIWGGEFLLVEKGEWRRLAHLRSFPLPGGERAAREPWRAAIGLLYEAFGDDALAMTGLAPLAHLSQAERGVLGTMLSRGVNAPSGSSAGRLFDAFASLCGVRQRMSYEGQAAAELEWAAEGAAPIAPYDFSLCDDGAQGTPWQIDWQPALVSALADLATGTDAGTISAAFHAGLARMIARVAHRAGQSRVALTGGCFQNALLAESTLSALREAGCQPILHRLVPPNDGGIALGQAVWASWREDAGEPTCA